MKKKFVAFGCKNINSTHSFIHYAYQRAFESLGWESHWVDNNDVDSFDFSNSLILTLGGWDHALPVRKDCKYILHNCDLNKYSSVLDNSLILQVFTTDVYDRDVEKLEDFVYYQKSANTLYQPWATDLLPNEINDKESLNFTNNKSVYWVGSIWNDNNQGNSDQINNLKNSLSIRGIQFEPKKVDYDKNKEIINNSFISPSLQGKWQCDKGYIPCRIFKNISYGEFGITNSKYVNELFKDMIVYDSDIDTMIEKAIERRKTITIEELNQQIRFVRDNHTYINRVNNILSIL